MTPGPYPPFSITLDTLVPDEMTSFYTERLGFELVETITGSVVYARRRLVHRAMHVEIVLRDCKPRPPIGSTPGSLFELTLRVPDPEAVAAGLRIEKRTPEEGPPEELVVRDSGNYKLVLLRTPE